MLLFLAFPALCMTYSWFSTVPRLLEQDISIDIIYWHLSRPTGGALVIYIVLFSVALYWHFWDIIQRNTLVAGSNAILSKYWIFLIAFGMMGIILSISTFPEFNLNSCDIMKEVMHSMCIVSQPDWISNLFLIAASIVLFICVAKAAISIKSRFSKTI
jgi:hypothetical protein